MRLLALLALLAAAAVPSSAQTPDRPRNVVLMIADGFGPASVSLGAAAKGAPLAFDSVLVGSVETSSADSRVTDSAAGATSYACGLKTYNGAIGVDAEGTPCRTVLEAAEARGLATGLVATSRITHATPASFGAHVANRSDEAEVARQLATSGVDLIMGGGREFFTRLPSGDGATPDARPLTVLMAEAGWTVAIDRPSYDALDALPAAAFLADSHLAYEIDREHTDQPSLAQMTRKALDLLASSPDGREHGFFLLIEGSRIDHAGHANDPAGHLGDIFSYDEAVATALAWAAADGNTLVVSTADHETGGITLGRDGIYSWDPAPLLRATASLEAMTADIRAGADIVEVVRAGTGVDSLDASTADALRGIGETGDLAALSAIVRDLESEPARIAWTTSGHTAVDVNLYAFGPGAERFHGRMVNAAVGRALFDALGLDR